MLAIYSVYTTPVLPHASPSLRQSFSGQGRNRTTDTTIFSRVLYQLSYLACYLSRHLARYLTRKKNPPGLSAAGGSARGARSVFLEAPLDGPPSRTRPRIRHRPSPSLLRVGPEHR